MSLSNVPTFVFRISMGFNKKMICPSGGIGRRNGLKIRRTRVRAGSSPASGISKIKVSRLSDKKD